MKTHLTLITLSLAFFYTNSIQAQATGNTDADTQIYEQRKQQTAKGLALGYEAPPELEASKILDPKLLKSDLYTIDERIMNNGYMNLYHVQSEYGSYEVVGTDHLRIRLHEIWVLHELESFSETSLFVDKTTELGIKTVNAPINAVKKSVDLLRNPEQIYDTAKQIPAGVSRIFSFAGRTAKKATASASAAIKKPQDGDASEDEGPSATQKTYEKSKEYLYDYTGQSRNMKEWLEHYAVDPFTSNKVLLDQISWIAKIESSIDVGFSFVPSLPGVGIIDDINKYYGKAQDVALYEPADVRKAANHKKFLDFGQEEDQIDGFFNNPLLTPTTQNVIIETLTALEGVTNRDALLDAAAKIESEAGRLFFNTLASQLQAYYLSETKLTALIDGTYFPAAVSAKNELIIILPTDYLAWSKELETEMIDFQKQAKQDYSIERVKLFVSGQTSDRCRRELGELGISVLANIDLVLPESG